MSLGLALRLLPGLIILALILAVIGQRSHINSLGHKLDNERAGRISDRQTYTSAQDMAAEKNRADLARIQQKQKEISDATKSRYNRDLAELRRLRSQNRTPQGSAGKPGVSEGGKAPGGTDGKGVLLSPGEYLLVQEISLKLMHLQNWVEEQTR